MQPHQSVGAGDHQTDVAAVSDDIAHAVPWPRLDAAAGEDDAVRGEKQLPGHADVEQECGRRGEVTTIGADHAMLGFEHRECWRSRELDELRQTVEHLLAPFVFVEIGGWPGRPGPERVERLGPGTVRDRLGGLPPSIDVGPTGTTTSKNPPDHESARRIVQEILRTAGGEFTGPMTADAGWGMRDGPHENSLGAVVHMLFIEGNESGVFRFVQKESPL